MTKCKPCFYNSARWLTLGDIDGTYTGVKYMKSRANYMTFSIRLCFCVLYIRRESAMGPYVHHTKFNRWNNARKCWKHDTTSAQIKYTFWIRFGSDLCWWVSHHSRAEICTGAHQTFTHIRYVISTTPKFIYKMQVIRIWLCACACLSPLSLPTCNTVNIRTPIHIQRNGSLSLCVPCCGPLYLDDMMVYCVYEKRTRCWMQ